MQRFASARCLICARSGGVRLAGRSAYKLCRSPEPFYAAADGPAERAAPSDPGNFWSGLKEEEAR